VAGKSVDLNGVDFSEVSGSKLRAEKVEPGFWILVTGCWSLEK
jgi:hypothetical protein